MLATAGWSEGNAMEWFYGGIAFILIVSFVVLYVAIIAVSSIVRRVLGRGNQQYEISA